jgi:hypothetical protein
MLAGTLCGSAGIGRIADAPRDGATAGDAGFEQSVFAACAEQAAEAAASTQVRSAGESVSG